MITLLSIKLVFSECTSLKEKRHQLQPLITRLRKEFNLAVAETGLQDYWQSAWISCVLVSTEGDHNSRVSNEIIEFINKLYPNIEIEEHHTEYR